MYRTLLTEARELLLAIAECRYLAECPLCPPRVTKALAKIDTALSQEGWVSPYSPPKEYSDVLILAYNGKGVFRGYLGGGYWWVLNGRGEPDEVEGVIGWMEYALPPAPKTDTGEVN